MKRDDLLAALRKDKSPKRKVVTFYGHFDFKAGHLFTPEGLRHLENLSIATFLPTGKTKREGTYRFTVEFWPDDIPPAARRIKKKAKP